MILNLVKKELDKPETFEKILRKIRVWHYDGYRRYTDEIMVFIVELGKRLPDLKRTNPDLASKYETISINLKWEMLENLPDDEVVEMFEKYYLTGLKKGTNLVDRLRIKMLIISIWLRDDYLKEIRQVLEKNTQRLGTKTIIVPGQVRPQPPTIGNWLLDYNDALGVGKHSDIAISNYFVTSANVAGLTTEEKELLRKTILFYELLKLGVRDPGSMSGYSLNFYGIRGTEAIPVESGMGHFVTYPALSRRFAGEHPIPGSPRLGVLAERKRKREVAKVKEHLAKIARKPLAPPITPPHIKAPKPPSEIEKEIEAKRKAEEERIARLEREMEPKVAPPPKVKIPKPLEVPKTPPRPEVAPLKIKPAPEFKPPEAPKPKPLAPPEIKPAPPLPPKPARPPRIEAAPPPPPKPAPPLEPKAPPKIESVDDIKKLGLDDFRSYREVPLDSARVITEKINSLLAEASPLDKIKALAFWKESNLYKLYIEMGRESMAQGISVKELAEKRRAEGKPFLSHEEFEAIVEISGSIG